MGCCNLFKKIVVWSKTLKELMTSLDWQGDEDSDSDCNHMPPAVVDHLNEDQNRIVEMAAF